MRTGIFIEYLESLNGKVSNRKRNIALLLDDFSAHEAAVRELGGERGLQHQNISD